MTIQKVVTGLVEGPRFQLPEPFHYLTPDALLSYCESRLRSIDAQVKTAFQRQTDRNGLNSALSVLSNSLSKKKAIDEGPADEGLRTEILANYDAAIQAAGGPTSPAGVQLAAERARFQATARGTARDGDTNSVDEGEMKGFGDAVGRLQGDINREGELQMIELQSLMSQRQTALQMTTNMVSALGESSRAIASKIGS